MSVDRPREKADISRMLAKEAEMDAQFPVKILVRLTDEEARFLARYQWNAGRHHSMGEELRQWVKGQKHLDEYLSRPMTDAEEREAFGKTIEEYVDEHYEGLSANSMKKRGVI